MTKPDESKDDEIKKVDVKEILLQAQKELRTVEHYASRIVTGGLENSVNLRVTTREEISKFRRKQKKLLAQLGGKAAHISLTDQESRINLTAPWTTLQVIDGTPIQAYIDAENRMGAIRIRLTGQVPSDLILYMSENYQNVSEANSTWTFSAPTGVTIFPKDQHITNPKKATDKDKKKF